MYYVSLKQVRGLRYSDKARCYLNLAESVRLSVLLFYYYSEREAQLWYVLLKPWWCSFTTNNLTSRECVVARPCSVGYSRLGRRVDIDLNGERGKQIHTVNN